MKIAVLADTHMTRKRTRCPEVLLRHLQDADVILHAGDWQTYEVYQWLSTYAPVYGVYGNTDGEDILRQFDSRCVLELKGFRIGIIHGDGKGQTTEKRALKAFEGESLDCIIYGHSHIPVLKYLSGSLLLNPGSPTDKRRRLMYSFAIIRLDDVMHAEHVFFL